MKLHIQSDITVKITQSLESTKIGEAIPVGSWDNSGIFSIIFVPFGFHKNFSLRTWSFRKHVVRLTCTCNYILHNSTIEFHIYIFTIFKCIITVYNKKLYRIVSQKLDGGS